MSLKNQFFTLLLGVSLGAFSLPSHSQDTVLHAQISGQGQPVVLIPGLMSDERVWQQTEAALAQHYEVHTLAFAGFGAHPSNPQLREAFTENAGAALKRYLQETTAGDAVVIGHSLGAFLGYQLASQQPQALECLIAVDGVPFFSALVSGNSALTAQAVEPQAQQMLAVYQQLTPEQMAMQVQMGASRQTSSEDNQARVVAIAKTSDPATVGRAMYELMITDLRAEVADLNVPTLQMAATGGFSTAEQKQTALNAYQQQIAGDNVINLLEFAESRHFIMWDQPEAFLSAVNHFIEERCHD
jgi:pimeloyl-ACP methyl ester carboxylesterase